MNYNFNPKTEEELEMGDLLPEGWYDFEVYKSEKKTSKSGNPMCALQLRVWDKEGKTHTVFDYLVFSKVNLNIKKVKRFCDTTGLAEDYKRGSIVEELSGLSGRLFLGIQQEQPNPSGGFYPKKNVVMEYAKDFSTIKKDDFFEDNIPF